MITHQAYEVRLARQEELKDLPAIEQAAGEMFAETHYAFLAVEDNSSENVDLTTDVVWVALDSKTNLIVGFAIAYFLSLSVHLRELAVLPDHGCRGIGRMLINAVADLAREMSVPSVTLTTFSDIPWNAPYYSRLGFNSLSPNSLPAELDSILAKEAAAGFPMANRVCMSLDL